MRRLALALSIAVLLLAATALSDAFAQVRPFGGLRPPPADGIVGWILAKQALFYRALSGLIRAAKTDGSAYWGLMGISFAYGIFHAAGRGHGKAVISSYLLANEGDLATRHCVIFCVGAAAGAGRDCAGRRRRSPDRRHGENDGRYGARH